MVIINITANATRHGQRFHHDQRKAGLTWNTGAGADGANAVAGSPAVVNTWGYEVTIPATDLGGPPPLPLSPSASGTLLFNGDGTLKSITPTVVPRP